MSVRIRFKRVGRPHAAFYRLVAIDRQQARDAKPIEYLGTFNPHKMKTPEAINLDRIRYWVSVAREVGVKAEFYSLSGKLLKTAIFKYDNTIQYAGNNIPFVSSMVIRDALIDAETTMKFGTVKVKKISAAEFDLGQMQ